MEWIGAANTSGWAEKIERGVKPGGSLGVDWGAAPQPTFNLPFWPNTQHSCGRLLGFGRDWLCFSVSQGHLQLNLEWPDLEEAKILVRFI